jgi:hypothetical protein
MQDRNTIVRLSESSKIGDVMNYDDALRRVESDRREEESKRRAERLDSF